MLRADAGCRGSFEDCVSERTGWSVESCTSEPTLQEPTRDPVRFQRHEVTKVAHYWLRVDALTGAIRLRESDLPYEGSLQ